MIELVLAAGLREGAGARRENGCRLELQISGCQEEHGDNGAEQRHSEVFLALQLTPCSTPLVLANLEQKAPGNTS